MSWFKRFAERLFGPTEEEKRELEQLRWRMKVIDKQIEKLQAELAVVENTNNEKLAELNDLRIDQGLEPYATVEEAYEDISRRRSEIKLPRLRIVKGDG